MTLNVEIDEETGAKLDELARLEKRSRSSQATKLLKDALELVASDRFDASRDQSAADEEVAA